MIYPDIMRFTQAADFLGLSERIVREKWIAWGIPGRKVGKSVLFSKRELIGWVESQQGRMTPHENIG